MRGAGKGDDAFDAAEADVGRGASEVARGLSTLPNGVDTSGGFAHGVRPSAGPHGFAPHDRAVTWPLYAPAVNAPGRDGGPDPAHAPLGRSAPVPPSGATLDVLDPARIDVDASRRAGEPRRGPARLRARFHPAPASAPSAPLLVLHDEGAGAPERWGLPAAVLEVPVADHAEGAGGAPDRSLASTDRDLARLRSSVLDLDAVLAAWPRRVDERIILVASGVAAAGALIALGAGLAAGVGAGEGLRHELLLDLFEGDTLHARIVDDVAPRIAAAVLIDPAGAANDWRDVALARITTPLALVERRAGAMARRAFAASGGSDRLHARVDSAAASAALAAALAARPARAVFEEAAARPVAFDLSEARQARAGSAEAWPTEICRSDFARDLLRTVWRAAAQSRLRPGWS